MNYKFKRITRPNTNLYTTNNFKPLDEKYFNKKWIANNEERNVVIRPTIKGRKSNEENSFK